METELHNMQVLRELIKKVENEEYVNHSAITDETNADFLRQFYDLFLDNDLDGFTYDKERKEFLQKLNYCVHCGFIVDALCCPELKQ